jgi:hypothetical protein
MGYSPKVSPQFRAGQAAVAAAGAAVLLWSALAPAFRDQEGHLTGAVGLPIAVGLAALLIAVTAASRLSRAALWFGLALVGQAAALQLIDAGKGIHYQHYKALGRFGETSPAVWALFGAQLAAVAWGFRAAGAAVWAWLRRAYRAWQLAFLGVAFVLTSATLSRDAAFYVSEVVLAACVQALNLATLVLMVRSVPDELWDGVGRAAARWLGEDGADAPGTAGLGRFAFAAALGVTSLSALLNVVSYQRHPHVPDETVYLYHARYLAQGRLAMPLPPVAEAFDIDLMEYDANGWYCPVPPGWPAVLAAGVFVGAPWLVNPILAGLNVLLTAALLRKLYGPRTARLAVLLLCASPWYVFLGMSYMTHMWTLTCTLVALVGLLRARETGHTRWAWLAGLAVGAVSWIRPLDAVTVAAPLGLWSLGVCGRRQKLSAVGAFVAGAVVVGAGQLAYNREFTGSPTKFPIMAYDDKHHGPNSNAYGFGPDRGMGWPLIARPGHDAFGALVNANLNATTINSDLFGWATGSLLLALVGALALSRREGDLLMVGLAASVFGFYFFYYFSGGPDFGARYWFLMLVPCLVLTVRGVEAVGARLRKGPAAPGGLEPRAVAAVAALCALSLLTWFPWRAIDKYYHYRGMRPDIRALAREHCFGNGLVLVRGEREPDYASAAIYNPLDLHSPSPVYAWDRGDGVRRQLIEAFPGRDVWVVDGPSVTGAGFRVARGPVPGSELLAEMGPAPAEPSRSEGTP